jgi:O-antigen/teichoic acid export membrane protein
LIGREDYRHFTPVVVVQKILIVLATITAIFVTQNIFVILGTYLASTSLANVLLYFYTLRRWPLNDQTDTETIPYGKKLSLMSAVGTAANQLDKIVLWYLTGPLAVAAYTIATALPKEVSGALGHVGVLALPKMAGRDKASLQSSLLRKVFIFFLGSIPITLAYVLAAPILFTIFLPQYIEYVFLSQVASMMILFAPVTLLVQYFQATMHTRALFAMQFVVPVVLIGLFFVLIPPLGALGAVLATIGRQIATFILLLYYFVTDK